MSDYSAEDRQFIRSIRRKQLALTTSALATVAFALYLMSSGAVGGGFICLAIAAILFWMAKAEGKRVPQPSTWQASPPATRQHPVEQDWFTRELLRDSYDGSIFELIYVSGPLIEAKPGDKLLFAVHPERLTIGSVKTRRSVRVTAEAISGLEVGSTQTDSRNAGLVGGGFGVEGFVAGAVTAAVINAATTRTTKQTLVLISTARGVSTLVSVELDSSQLNRRLAVLMESVIQSSKERSASSPSIQVPNPVSSGADIAGRLSQLAQLHESGALSDEEFAKAKQKILEA